MEDPANPQRKIQQSEDDLFIYSYLLYFSTRLEALGLQNKYFPSFITLRGAHVSCAMERQLHDWIK